MLVYIGLFGNLQLKQQLKITLLQILPNTLKLHFQNASFKTVIFSKTHFYKQLIQTDPQLMKNFAPNHHLEPLLTNCKKHLMGIL